MCRPSPSWKNNILSRPAKLNVSGLMWLVGVAGWDIAHLSFSPFVLSNKTSVLFLVARYSAKRLQFLASLAARGHQNSEGGLLRIFFKRKIDDT